MALEGERGNSGTSEKREKGCPKPLQTTGVMVGSAHR